VNPKQFITGGERYPHHLSKNVVFRTNKLPRIDYNFTQLSVFVV